MVFKSPKANYQIFNVGSGRADRVFDFATAVSAVAGIKLNPRIERVFRMGSARHLVMDVGKLKKLGWKPMRTLRDNVRDYVFWVKKHPEVITYLYRTYHDLKQKNIVR